MRKTLLEEMLAEIAKDLPRGQTLGQFILNTGRLADAQESAHDPVILMYWWGQLLGAARWMDMAVRDLLIAYDLWPEVECQAGGVTECQVCGCYATATHRIRFGFDVRYYCAADAARAHRQIEQPHGLPSRIKESSN